MRRRSKLPPVTGARLTFSVRRGRWLLSALALFTLTVARAAGGPPTFASGQPIHYPGMTVLVNRQGVQAPGYRFDDHSLTAPSGRARWIWTATGAASVAARFVKTVTLDQAPAAVHAWVTADAKYLLYVNGRLVSRGPVDIGRDYRGGSTGRWFYDERDLTPYFTSGTNVIAAVVFRQWPIGFVVSRGKPGFWFEAEVTDAAGRKTRLASDASWHAVPAAEFVDDTTCDFTRAPAAWRDRNFDVSAWPRAREVPDVWEPLVPSEIPPRLEASYPPQQVEGLPANGTFAHDGTFRVVFDRVLSGYPVVRVEGGAGATVTIQAHRRFTFRLAGGRECLEFPFMDEIAPAFTVTLQNVTAPVRIEKADAIFTSQPVEYSGAFACSDEDLNRLWAVSRWTVQLNLQTHHLDSPNHQEPISDPGDYVIENGVNFYAFAQPWLARQDIRKFGWLLQDEHERSFHTSYSLYWLQMLMDQYRYTGDESLVREMAPEVFRLLDTYTSWRGANGLISQAPNYMFMDWVTIGGFNCHHPPAVIGQGYLTALYYHGLGEAARVARLIGDTRRAERYEHLRRDVAAAFNRELWVPARGLYRDGKPFQTSVKPQQWLPADKDIETFSPHVNTLAVLYDLAPRNRQAAIMNTVMAATPLNTQPWFMHWVFAALDHAGVFERYAVAQLHRWQIVPATQSFREMWDSGDLSHGWCATPLEQMSARLLGVTPATPGYRTIAIRPQPCGLAWARGRVPTPFGEVAVAWAQHAGRFTMDVTVPAGARADVVLPVSHVKQPLATMNGRTARSACHVGPGQYHFEISERHSAPAHEETACAVRPSVQLRRRAARTPPPWPNT